MRIKIFAGLAGLAPHVCQAAELDGSLLSMWWGIPFAGLLLSLALLPLLAPGFWHHHFGKLTFAWTLGFIVPCILVYGAGATTAAVVHSLAAEYIPFIILLIALFTVAGGICLCGNLHGTPWLNTRLLLLGTLLASVMGTTGASMLMIRPLIRANDNRKHVVHIIVFFIFLVSNVGGALTPLGDPPLFLGFLLGVDFFWTVKNLYLQTLFMCVALLIIFYFLDRHYYFKGADELPPESDVTPDSPLGLQGKFNFVLLGVIIGLVLMSGMWKPGIVFTLMGTEVALQNVVRDVMLIGVTLLSLIMTPQEARDGNGFTWGPMLEVGKLFAGIFITIVPVIAMLKAAEAGAFAGVIKALVDSDGQPDNMMYFWSTGLLSAFLDNAPTYLVFFNSTGGEVQLLMTRFAGTLAAISCGAVFMGALSYIGNAPNMMVKSIAEERGIPMPSFFGYMAWSCCVLLPLLVIMSLVFFNH